MGTISDFSDVLEAKAWWTIRRLGGQSEGHSTHAFSAQRKFKSLNTVKMLQKNNKDDKKVIKICNCFIFWNKI